MVAIQLLLAINQSEPYLNTLRVVGSKFHPLLHRIVLVNTHEHLVGGEGTCDTEGTGRVHVGGHHGHTSVL